MLFDNTKTEAVQCRPNGLRGICYQNLTEERCIPVLRLPAFDTTSPSVGDRLKPRKCASRESHPSEDLSELPPLLEAVAGQEYLTLTRSLRNSLSYCFVDGWVPLAALMASFMRKNRTGGSWRILQSRFALVGRFARERISVAGYDRAGPVFFKVRKQIKPVYRSGQFKGTLVVLWPVVTVRPLLQCRTSFT